jgi:hypothetical protein
MRGSAIAHFDDWFGSNFIIAFAVISGLAFLLMIPWEATRRNPAADVRMVATRHSRSFRSTRAITRRPSRRTRPRFDRIDAPLKALGQAPRR